MRGPAGDLQAAKTARGRCRHGRTRIATGAASLPAGGRRVKSGPAGVGTGVKSGQSAACSWQVRAQVNGKLRAQLQVSPTAGKEEVLAAAKAEPNVAKFLDGKAIKKEVFVPGKLVNFVAA